MALLDVPQTQAQIATASDVAAIVLAINSDRINDNAVRTTGEF